MKNLISIQSIVLLVSVTILSCNLVELEEPSNALDSEGNLIQEVSATEIEATDENSFRHLLADSSSKSWETSFFTLAGSNLFTSCRLDDIMILSTDGGYQYSGGTLCGAEDNKTSRIGNWEINFQNKTITFDRGTNNEYQARVIGLSEDELRVVGSYNGMEVRGLYSKR